MATSRADSAGLWFLLLNAKELLREERCKGGSPACNSRHASALHQHKRFLNQCTPPKRQVSACAGLVGSLLEVAFHCLALFLCASAMLFRATGAPRPFFKHHLGPVCSGSIRASFPEGRRRVLGERGAVAPAAGCHPGSEGLWPLLPDGEIQTALCAWFCCTLPLALATVLLSVG